MKALLYSITVLTAFASLATTAFAQNDGEDEFALRGLDPVELIALIVNTSFRNFCRIHHS